jgi:hypothetical protein
MPGRCFRIRRRTACRNRRGIRLIKPPHYAASILRLVAELLKGEGDWAEADFVAAMSIQPIWVGLGAGGRRRLGATPPLGRRNPRDLMSSSFRIVRASLRLSATEPE